ncbi:MAG: IclR family transcriptional regulator C-terminal domain-containing protein [Hyphomonadaceae bacterium]|nr:IclR family transcriptional regulator C-terminal domain-containing protein [Hyphomonadaceae bacterium]
MSPRARASLASSARLAAPERVEAAMSESDKPEKDPEYLSTLERGLSVLRAFGQHNPEMQLSEVAAATNLPPAVARRCLHTLVQLGYVAKHGRRFLLRPEVLAFGSAYVSSMNLETVALPPLQNLRDQTGDSSSMAVLSGHDILYIAHVSTHRPIRVSANVGTRFPAHATSLGKVLLAFQPEAAIEAYLETAQLTRFTERTVTSPAEMRARLARVRENGFDSACDELDFGIVSVAVPVFDKDRRITSAINCSTMPTRISEDELVRTRLPLLQQAAREIQTALIQRPYLSHSLTG